MWGSKVMASRSSCLLIRPMHVPVKKKAEIRRLAVIAGGSHSGFWGTFAALRWLGLGFETRQDGFDSGISCALAPSGRPSALPMPSYSPFLANGDDSRLRYPGNSLHPRVALWTGQPTTAYLPYATGGVTQPREARRPSPKGRGQPRASRRHGPCAYDIYAAAAPSLRCIAADLRRGRASF